MATSNHQINDKSSYLNTNKTISGRIISCYRKCFNNNNDINSYFLHGMLSYVGNNESESIEYCTQDINLKVGDIVTFDFSNDVSAVNQYANNVIKFKQQEMKENKSNNKYPIRLICISDTHNNHEELTDELCDIYESENDILIHAGDMTDSGTKTELKAVNRWFGKLPYKHIIITAGNMDGIGLDNNKNNKNTKNNKYASSIFTNAIYLEHESYYLEKLNLRFFASPYSLRFFGGFQINNEKEAELKWKEIANNIDILICHGPPANILDSIPNGKHCGDKILYNHIINRIKPKIMLFGHIHSSYGYIKHKGIHFYNCAQDNSLRKYSSTYYNSNKKNNNIDKDEKPHIINLANLS